MVKIFIITHQQTPALNNNLYIPLQVGPNHEIFKGILNDHTGDHIAEKNKNFCELTAAYWISKNYNEADYIGLCHYRRYFNFYKNPLSLKPSTQKKITEENFKNSKLFKTTPEKQEQLILNIFKSYDVILPVSYDLGISLSENYAIGHQKEDFDLTKQIILEKYPEYESSIEKYLNNESKFYVANMLITSKKIWQAYYKWLFDILFELEKRITIPEDSYQARIFGFISERLTALYFQHHNFRIKETPLYKII